MSANNNKLMNGSKQVPNSELISTKMGSRKELRLVEPAAGGEDISAVRK